MRGASRLAISGLLGAVALASVQATPAQEARNTTGNDSNALEVIIVTAQKRSEDIQTVPMSISTIGQADLEQLHATRLTDFAGYMPGFQVTSAGTPSQQALAIRGIGGISSGATVATYLDETPLGSSSLYGGAAGTVLDLLPFDVQSFDVLRGPQGTLYGANALGGLVKYVTRLPDLDHFSGRIGGDAFAMDGANNAGLGGHASLNAPLVPGVLGMTASFARENTPGFVDNALTGQRNQNGYSQQVGRLAVLWRPTEDISLAVSGIQQKIKADNNTFVALDTTSLQPLYGNLRNDNVIPETFAQDLDYFSATLNVNLGWADLVSATSYSKTRSDSVLDATLIYGVVLPLLGGPAGISAFDSDLRLNKTTEEVRLASKAGDRLEWLVGAFYSHEDSQNNQLVTAQLPDGTSIAGFDPLATIALPAIYREYAAFGDVTFKFNSTFDISGGLRWARNDQDFTQISAGALVPNTITPGGSAQSVVTYSAGPRWHINSDTMAYVRVASGYQPGGPNVVLPGVPPTVNADKLTNYELGLKTLLDSRRLMIDLAAFYIRWQDIQVGATNGVVSYLANGGTASSQGLELTTLYTPTEGLRLGFNAAYTDAKLTEDVPSIGGLSGDRLPFSPKWSGSATADYAFLRRANWTARAGGGVRYTGDRETAVDHNSMALPLKSYAVLDLNAEVSNERWTVRLFAKNATNKLAYDNAIPVNNAATGAMTEVHGVPLQPRVIGVGIDATF